MRVEATYVELNHIMGPRKRHTLDRTLQGPASNMLHFVLKGASYEEILEAL
jgi:hypothetical protein